MNAPKKRTVKDYSVKMWEKLVEICEFAEKHPLISYLIKLLLDIIKWWLFRH